MPRSAPLPRGPLAVLVLLVAASLASHASGGVAPQGGTFTLEGDHATASFLFEIPGEEWTDDGQFLWMYFGIELAGLAEREPWVYHVAFVENASLVPIWSGVFFVGGELGIGFGMSHPPEGDARILFTLASATPGAVAPLAVARKDSLFAPMPTGLSPARPALVGPVATASYFGPGEPWIPGDISHNVEVSDSRVRAPSAPAGERTVASAPGRLELGVDHATSTRAIHAVEAVHEVPVGASLWDAEVAVDGVTRRTEGFTAGYGTTIVNAFLFRSQFEFDARAAARIGIDSGVELLSSSRVEALTLPIDPRELGLTLASEFTANEVSRDPERNVELTRYAVCFWNHLFLGQDLSAVCETRA